MKKNNLKKKNKKKKRAIYKTDPAKEIKTTWVWKLFKVSLNIELELFERLNKTSRSVNVQESEITYCNFFFFLSS